MKKAILNNKNSLLILVFLISSNVFASNNFILDIPEIYILIIIVIYSLLLNEIRQRELDLIKSRGAIMLSQIQPHFMFNSLTAIAMLCDKDSEIAKKMTLEFSQYLRGNLDSLSESDLIPFEQELKHIEAYLNLEKAIYGKGLNVIYDIQNSDFKLPVLTLQPIIENAVKHGIGRREGGGTVMVSAKETDKAFIMIVTDNGLGFEAVENGHKCIGIKNVTYRLSVMCGGTLAIESNPGLGSTVTITLPK